MTGRALLASLVGALVAAVLGLLTFGAQATVNPDHVPLAVAGPPALTQRIAAEGGDHVAWHVVATQDEGRALLEDKTVYGVLTLGQPVQVTLSGAINPGGAQVAQQVLTTAAMTVSAATPGAPAPQVTTLHPATTAGRVAPWPAARCSGSPAWWPDCCSSP
ncbi:hypothetical protein GCM10029964_103290 [Kibdelosporangium lantanae]